jgi:hypothetical protein
MQATSAPYSENEFALSEAEWDEKTPHPPYLSDLEPSDFYLFGRVKQLLAGHKFPDRGAVLDAVQDFLKSIEKLPWIAFFSLRWRDSSDIFQSMSTRLNDQPFRVQRFFLITLVWRNVHGWISHLVCLVVMSTA